MAIQDDAAKQLGALPFGNIIGGPLVAAIEAQAKAARTTADFIESVAYGVPSGASESALDKKALQTMEFVYTSGEKEVKLSVPLLTVVPVPYIRIEAMTIQFKANISAETSASDTTSNSSAVDLKSNLSGRYGWGPAKVEASFSAAYSSKKDSTAAANSKYAVEYTMDITVNAAQEDMPVGMQRLLNLLNDSIKAAA